MTETKARVLEEQVDQLAQRVVTVSLQMEALLKLLGQDAVAERIGIEPYEIRYAARPVGAGAESSRHRMEREGRVRDSERETDLAEMLREFRRHKQRPSEPR